MPRAARSEKPPEPMTWGRALPVLLVAALFDAIRFVFEWFWLFGPTLFGAAIAATAGGGWIGTGLGATAAGASAYFADGLFEMMGLILAMIAGLAGWLVIFLLLALLNHRIFKHNSILVTILGLIVSETPFVGSIPSITLAMWRMYHVQIREERAAMKRWEKENAAAVAKQRQEQVARQARQAAMQAAQVQESRLAQMAETQQAAEDDAYIPDEGQQAT